MTESGRCDAANVTGLIGRRVVVRHRVGDKQTDAVGELSADGADLVVQTRRGPVRVARSAVTAVRAIPPAPAAAGVADGDRPAGGAVRRRLARVRRRAARGLAAARRRGVHGAGQQRARDRRPRPADRRRAGGGADVRRTPRHHAAGAGAGRLAVGQGRRRAGVGAGRRPRGGSRRVRAGGGPRQPAVGPAADGRRRATPQAPGGRPDGGRGGEHTGAAATVEVGAPTDAWWRLVLGGPPTPAQRHVLGGAGALTARGRAGRGRRGAGGRGGGPPARVGAHRRPRPPPPRPRHRAAGRGRALGTRVTAPAGACCRWRCTTPRRSRSTPGPGGPSTTATATWCPPAADPAPGATPTAPPPPRRRRAAATASVVVSSASPPGPNSPSTAIVTNQAKIGAPANRRSISPARSTSHGSTSTDSSTPSGAGTAAR